MWFFMLLSIFGAVFVLYAYLTWHQDYWKVLGIQYVKPIPYFGSLLNYLLLRKSIGEIMDNIYKKFESENVVGMFEIGWKAPLLVIRDPAIVHKVLVADYNHFSENYCVFDDDLDSYVKNSLFFLKNHKWKEMKTLISPAFTAGRIRHMYSQLNQIAVELVSYLKQLTSEVQLKEISTRYMSEITSRLALGINGRSFIDSKPIVLKMGEDVFEGNLNLAKFILIMAFPPLRRIFKLRMIPYHVAESLEGILHDIISQRKLSKAVWNDFVQFTINLIGKKEGSTMFSEKDVITNSLLFFVEGYEASATVLSHLLYHLAVHQTVQDRLFEEIEATMEKHNGVISCDTLTEMSYLNLVFLESNRILPVQFGTQKVCTKRYEMDIGKLEPLVVEKGTRVYIPIYSIHNDPAYWESPEEFIPERFAHNGFSAYKSKGVYLPFSDGPRMCIGSRLAMVMVKVALVHILHSFHIEPSARTPQKVQLDPKQFTVGHRGGLFVKLIQREN